MQQNQEQVKTDEELEEEAFQARMSELNGDDAKAPASTEPTEESASNEDISSETEVEQEEKQERIEVIPGYTKEELEAALVEIPRLRKGLDTVSGTLGEKVAAQQKLIEELRNQKQQQVEQVQSQVSKLSPESLKRLRVEFPELAEVLAEDLSEIIGTSQAPDLSGYEQKFQSRLDERSQAIEKKIAEREIRMLKREHPDFNEVAGYSGVNENGFIQWNNPAFGNWLSQQPKEKQDEIIHGESALDIADIITEYKKSLKPATPVKKPTNLERAVQPQGVPSVRTTSDLDEEEAAFNARLRELHHRL